MTDATLPPLPHRFRPGTARAAFAYRDFRIIWIGVFLSSVGTWMQTTLLGGYVDDRFHSGVAVALMVFALLGPTLLLSIPGGVLADKLPRRGFLIAMQSVQMVFSALMALLVSKDASLGALFACNLAIGIGQALNAPAFQASIPMLVDRRDLNGAVALNSTMINGSRVIGPAIAALLLALNVSVPQIFLLNALTYFFVIASLLVVHIPSAVGDHKERGWRQVLTGVRIARERPLLGRILWSLALFSFLCLPYVGLFPTVVRLNFGATGSTYQWLYVVWGAGACVGALAIATTLARYDKRTLIPPGFLGFAISLGAFAVARQVALAFPIGFLLGFFYFGTTTAMATVLQENMEDHERARVMSLWFMAFGGTVPLGVLAFGPLVDRFGARWVLLFGAACALFLAWWCDLPRLARASSAFRPHAFSYTLEPGHAAALHQDGVATAE
jgi:MFS family permease